MLAPRGAGAVASVMVTFPHSFVVSPTRRVFGVPANSADAHFGGTAMELVIGTRKWSTWSMRPWLALKHTGAAFGETLITLREENDATTEAILPHSPSGLV